MIRRVELTMRAEKQVRRLPVHVGEKLLHWVYLVMDIGLGEVRSIRLSRGYRAMYRPVREGDVEVLSVEEVSKHGY